MRRKYFSLFALVVILSMLIALPGFADGPDVGPIPPEAQEEILSAKGEPAVYVVQLIDNPVIAYEGDIPGLAATKPDRGDHINPNSARVKKYVKFLESKHADALAIAGGEKFYNYFYSFNGFAAVLTPSEAVTMAKLPDVVMLFKDEFKFPVTDNSPEFLGLTATGGLWDSDILGEDVIIGVIDTGIWPEHPSFSDQTDLVDRPGNSGKRTLAYDPPPADWYGTCQSGELWSQDDCNNKLIGARYFKDGFTNNEIKISNDYLSARDADGHGSHTASTAGGNAGVSASIMGVDYGEISGMAPRARIAMYKACWADAGCAGSDLTMAIDQAVADGVDVINYSIGSSSTTLASDDIAFLYAANAGVFVATSAGNAGPGPSTLGSPSWNPWLTTVGASTQDRTFQGSALLGDTTEYFGASVTGGTDMLPLVDSVDAGSELCIPGELDPGVVTGKNVLCRRGAIARVDKSLAVDMAGGAGMILYNASDSDTQNTDNHWVPSVHINNTDGLAIKAYIATEGAGATALITGGTFTTIDAPWMAAFSSRGPNAGAMDIIKPDITAPGVNILAANSPTAFLGAPDQLFQSIGGTSMSSPHVAGIFALLKDAHPDWSPAMAKSAIMTTAYQDVKKEDGTTQADPFDMGAGHLNPNPAVDPGLVYDAGFYEYLGFLCGNNPANISQGLCDLLIFLGYPTDPSDLNYPSIGIAELAGSQTVTRTVTNVGPAGTYNVSVDAPPGIDVVVNPLSLTLDVGESAPYDVIFTNVSAPIDVWQFGSLTWNDGLHSVRSPIAVNPTLLAAPSGVSETGTEGSLEFYITFGYSGAYTAGAHGLAPAVMQPDNVVDDPANDINAALATGVGITWHGVNVPAGATYARFSLFDEYTDGVDDLDLYVWHPDGFFAGGSGSGTSAEEVNVLSPQEGTYYVAVHGWQTDGPDSKYTLFSWAFGLDMGNMTLTAPAAATLGATETITVGWAGLDADTKYLGAVSHSDGGLLGLTIVRIDTD
jgi:subtilisin family serine protease